MPHHLHEGAPRVALRLGLLTVSDTRTFENDRSGSLLEELVLAGGHRVAERRIVRDEPDEVREAIRRWLDDPECDAVISSGGTGVATRDRTYEVVSALIERRLDGFGELFRQLSYREIGSAAMLSRAVGGVARGKPLFALPGAPAAVRLALEALILPELGHLVAEIRKPG